MVACLALIYALCFYALRHILLCWSAFSLFLCLSSPLRISLCLLSLLSLALTSLSAAVLFLGCLAHLLKAVASRPCCCCYYVLTSDLTPRERPTGRRVCGTFWEWKDPPRKRRRGGGKKGKGRSISLPIDEHYSQ